MTTRTRLLIAFSLLWVLAMLTVGRRPGVDFFLTVAWLIAVFLVVVRNP